MARLDPIAVRKVNRRVANHHTINGSDVSPALHSNRTYLDLLRPADIASNGHFLSFGRRWAWLAFRRRGRMADSRRWALHRRRATRNSLRASGLRPQTSIWLDPAIFGQWNEGGMGYLPGRHRQSACQTMQRCKYQVRMFECCPGCSEEFLSQVRCPER